MWPFKFEEMVDALTNQRNILQIEDAQNLICTQLHFLRTTAATCMLFSFSYEHRCKHRKRQFRDLILAYIMIWLHSNHSVLNHSCCRSGFCKLACISSEKIYDVFSMTPSLDTFESNQLADARVEGSTESCI